MIVSANQSRHVSVRVLAGAVAVFSVLLGSGNLAQADNPYIGGTPSYTEEDYFSGAGFHAEVYSYVYTGVGTDLPDDAVLPPLGSGESLFVYFVQNTGATGNIDLLGLLNPAGINPHSIGLSSVVPNGWTEDGRTNPSLYEGSVQLVQYQWSASSYGYLAPGDWALVFHRIMGLWQPVDAFVGFGADLDSEQIPGPALIPEPGMLGMALASVLLAWRRRK